MAKKDVAQLLNDFVALDDQVRAIRAYVDALANEPAMFDDIDDDDIAYLRIDFMNHIDNVTYTLQRASDVLFDTIAAVEEKVYPA